MYEEGFGNAKIGWSLLTFNDLWGITYLNKIFLFSQFVFVKKGQKSGTIYFDKKVWPKVKQGDMENHWL